MEKNLQNAIQKPVELELLVGQEKGRRYPLSGVRLTLGRAEDNDIVLPIEGISRHHAVLEQREDQWWISDNQSKNGVLVNGVAVESQSLQPGDLVQIGAYKFKFLEAMGNPESSESPMARLYEFKPSNPQAKKRLFIYSAVALLLGLFYLTLSSENETESTPKPIQKLARDFDAAKEPNLNREQEKSKIVGLEDPVLTGAEQELSKLPWKNPNVKEAELYFRLGQREYLNRNLGRAIDFFKTSLTLDRSHELADKYLGRATAEVEIEAKRNMDIAISYLHSLQYQRAIYHFNQVVELMSHRPKEPIVLEAQRYIEVCKKSLQAAELFP